MQKKLNTLLKYLENQTKPQTSTELANALSVSVRSVKNYVKDINALYNKKIILSSRNGYSLNPLFSASLIIEDTDSVPQTWEERAFYIIKRLILEQNTCVELFDLCDNLCISYSTVKSVISTMNKTFSSYHVEFYCENDCVFIKGSENRKRSLISYVVNTESKTSYMDTKQLQNYFVGIDINKIQNIIQNIFKDHGFYLNDFSTINLILQIVILINRKLNGNPLESGNNHFSSENEKENMLVNDLCCKLETEFKLVLNQYEQSEIHMLIKANASYTQTPAKKELEGIVNQEFIHLTEYYISQIRNMYLLDLSSDTFFVPFCLHLKNLLLRAKNNCFSNNPMIDSIKKDSPIIFDIAIFIGLDLMERYNISITEDEIGLLAIHIGAEIERQSINNHKASAIVLCPNYQNLSMEISNKLLMYFGNQLNLIGTVHNEEELEELEKRTLNIKFKILFTTIPIQKKYDYTVVPITPFNLNAQYDTIQDALYKHEALYNNYKLKKYFHEFFDKELFLANPDIDKRDDILTLMCNKLYDKNYTNAGFIQKVFRRENAATTAFNNVAIPHSVNMDAYKTSISITISKKGIQWGNNTVHLILLLAINKTDKQNFRILYESLISLFSEDSMIQNLRNCTSFEEFESLIFNSNL